MDFMRDFTISRFHDFKISGDHLKEKTSKTKLNEMTLAITIGQKGESKLGK